MFKWGRGLAKRSLAGRYAQWGGKKMNLKTSLILIFVFFYFSCNTINDNEQVTTKGYSKEDILTDLDDIGNDKPNKWFLDLGHGYFALSGSRISLYADSTRWAIVMEKTGYNNRSFNYYVELVFFGNCLTYDSLEKNFSNVRIVYLLNDAQELKNIEDGFELISHKADSVRIRDTKILIEHNTKKYTDLGIYVSDYENVDNQIDFVSFLRYLETQNRELLRANEDELRVLLPANLPKLMIIDKWYHEEYNCYSGPPEGSKPSSYETFQLIADVLFFKDTSKYKPTLKPNNGWASWPQSGDM